MKLPNPTKSKIFGEILPVPETKSGLIIDTHSNLDKYRLKVLSVGPKVEHIKVGDIVRYDHNSAIDIKWDGKQCVFVDEQLHRLLVV